ncbi:MAG: hypothetical protein HW416_3528 [Chloroflexi bacterium]|nr:hypothetical protein [Chloroflexota bacterium]
MVTLGETIEAYLREALKEFEKEEATHYVPANVRRDIVAATRFVDFLLGRFNGKS